jgi:nitroimidazol reductase NimA-like FMN-containing flavoprotein (pyridoxamine 5'-phosphate oxidase superfamily)
MPSRREQIQLTDDEIADFLAASRTVILVSNGKDGYPHPMPMWFYADAAGAVYCTTFSKSQKVSNLTRDPRATLLVESGEAYAELKSVLIFASAEIIADHEVVVDTLVRIQGKDRNLSEEQLGAVRGAVAKTADKRVVLKFVPERYVSWDHGKLGGRY